MVVLKRESNSSGTHVPAQLTKGKLLLHHIDTLTKINVKIDQLIELPTFYWLKKLHKQKRSTEGCSKFKSPETRQVQERLVSTLEHMQVPKWDRTRCPEE